jgi:hypothetical protein
VSAGLCPTNRVKENTTAKAAINAETVIVFTYALLLPAFVDASHIRIVAYRDATERALDRRSAMLNSNDFDYSQDDADELQHQKMGSIGQLMTESRAILG